MDSKEWGRAVGTDIRRGTDVSSIAFVAMAQESLLDDVTIAEHAGLFAQWDEHWTGKRGMIVREGGRLYRSLHDVGAGQNTRPSETPGMWAPVADPAEKWPAWSAPLGAQDAYGVGAKVSHGGTHWVSSMDGNVWEPGVFGWEPTEQGGSI